MKKYLLIAIMALPASLLAQGLGLGVKAGINFANITNAKMINSSNRTGFHAGVFMAPPSKGILGSRTELVFSRQGYNFKTGSNSGNVNLDYIILPQYMAINITKFVQVHIGGQVAILVSAKVDSAQSGGLPGAAGKVMDFYNRFDYGYGGGVEVRPVAGLVIGARINISLNKMYKQPEAGETPSFFPGVDVKSNVVMGYVGWVFGKR